MTTTPTTQPQTTTPATVQDPAYYAARELRNACAKQVAWYADCTPEQQAVVVADLCKSGIEAEEYATLAAEFADYAEWYTSTTPDDLDEERHTDGTDTEAAAVLESHVGTPEEQRFCSTHSGTDRRKEPPMAQTTCPISREHFRTTVTEIPVTIAGKTVMVDPKEFSTGSLGWYLADKVQIEVGGKKCTVQVGLNLTIVGSKALPQDQE